MGLLDGLMGRRQMPQQFGYGPAPGYGQPQQPQFQGPQPNQNPPQNFPQQPGPRVTDHWPPGYPPQQPQLSDEQLKKMAEDQAKEAQRQAREFADRVAQNPGAWIDRRTAAWEAKKFAVKGQQLSIITIAAGVIAIAPAPINWVAAAASIIAGAVFLMKFKPYVEYITQRYGV